MKLLRILVAALVSSVSAAEIDSKVIHNYSYVLLQYEYLEGFSDLGLRLTASYEFHNVIAYASGEHIWSTADYGVDADVREWDARAGLGYVFRFQENHFNIVPRFEFAYEEIDYDFGRFGSGSTDALIVRPSLLLSYAINNRLAIHEGYMYIRDLDADEGVNALFLGPTVALTDRIGLDVRAFFFERGGFGQLLAGLSYHF